jgi:hypothetical protein
MPVDSKHQMDIVWIIWEILIFYVEQYPLPSFPIVKNISNCLLNMFCLKYSSACIKKRKSILYFMVSLITEPLLLSEEIITSEHKDIVGKVKTQINLIYSQIKENEQGSKTDYLFRMLKAEI